MRLSLFAALALSTVNLAAHADTTYTYTGQPFSSAVAPLTTSDSLRGSFSTTSPLTPDAYSFEGNSYATTLSSFSFTDGVHTFNQTDSLLVGNFYADAMGAITNWEFIMLGDVNGIDIGFGSTRYPDPYTPYNDVITIPFAGDSVNEMPGSFTTGATSTPVSPTPEPSSLLLLATGLLGSYGLIRRQAVNG